MPWLLLLLFLGAYPFIAPFFLFLLPTGLPCLVFLFFNTLQQLWHHTYYITTMLLSELGWVELWFFLFFGDSSCRWLFSPVFYPSPKDSSSNRDWFLSVSRHDRLRVLLGDWPVRCYIFWWRIDVASLLLHVSSSKSIFLVFSAKTEHGMSYPGFTQPFATIIPSAYLLQLFRLVLWGCCFPRMPRCFSQPPFS